MCCNPKEEMRKFVKRWFLYAAIGLWLLSSSSGLAQSPGGAGPVLDIGSRLELFLDDYLIHSLGGGGELRLHHPEPQGIVMVHDEPWEGTGSGYHSIFKDGGKYKMYYKSWEIDYTPGKVKNPAEIFCAYAESDDGIHWRKPDLGLYEFEGSKDNNIVFIKGNMGGVNADGGHPAVFPDENPDVPEAGRYKALLIDASESRGLFAFKSPDGIHWTPMSQKPIITDGAFDSQNLAFWDNINKEYRAYWRYKAGGEVWEGLRSIRTATSRDFIKWSEQEDLQYKDSPEEHLYTNVVKPYYRAPHIFLGFPTRYIERGWSESMRALPELEHRKKRAEVSERYGTALTEALFMASRDGVLFKRWNEAFLRPGIERAGTWYYGQNYLAWSFVETESSFEGAPNELSFYATEGSWTEQGSALRRYTLRIDGFVSVNAPMSGGELVTKPLTFSGDELVLNFSSSAAGDIRVEIQDVAGNPISGFALEDSAPIFGDTIERVVKWESGGDLSSLEGKPVRLRFVLKDADLYSLRFR